MNAFLGTKERIKSHEDLEALRVPSVGVLASASRRAAGWARVSGSTALTPFSRARASARISRTLGRNGVSTALGSNGCGGRAELAFDERKSSLAVLGAIALMGVGVVTVAAVWICGVTVRLDLGSGWALETGRTRSKSASIAGSYVV